MPCSLPGLPGAREREKFQRLGWHEMAIKNRQWILARRPVGEIRDGDLLLKTTSLPVVGPGELLVRTHYLSLDPTNRIWMSDIDQYMEPVMLDAPMRGIVSGEVVGSGVPTFKLGDTVMGLGSCVTPVLVPPVISLRFRPTRGVHRRLVFGSRPA